ncbi:hypothetical protein JNW90_32345 [Micromonospora sp. STR1s_5]|nr:hypothetical protein [Micromonospora sp. STR1s_5]
MTKKRLLATAVSAALISALVDGNPAMAQTPGWETVPTPNIGAGPNQFEGISGTSGADVWAVGTYKSGSNSQPLAAHWDGDSWKAVDVPAPAGKNAVELYGVAAVAPSNVWAVGRAGTTFDLSGYSLITHWDGVTWQNVSAPTVGEPDEPDVLKAVAAVAPDDIWAVGHQYTLEEGAQALAMHWNGQSWTVVPTPYLGPGHAELFDVAVRSANDVWAVGYGPLADGQTGPLVLRWDGDSWSRMNVPNDRQTNTIFTDVALNDRGEVFVAGSAQWRTWQGSLTGRATVARYDGSAWSYELADEFHTEGTSLGDIAIGSAGEVWIAGFSRIGSRFAVRSGGDWKSVEGAAPNVEWGPDYGALAVLDGRLLAVGSYYSGSESQSLTYGERSAPLY